jgi:hypothetical protein
LSVVVVVVVTDGASVAGGVDRDLAGLAARRWKPW